MKIEKDYYLKKVLVINEGGSDNLGDQAISKSLESLLLEKGCNVETYNFTRVYHVDNFSNMNKLLNIKARKTFYLKTFFTKIALLRQTRWIQLHIKKIIDVAKNRYDIAFIGGGQLILSNTIFPIAMFLWILILRIFGTKVILIGVGSGNSFNLIDRILYKIALKLTNKILLRDQESIAKVKNIFGIQAYFIPDLAFCYPIEKIENKKNIHQKIVVGIIEYGMFCRYAKEIGKVVKTESEYIKLWIDDILALNLNISKIILTSTTSEDLSWSLELYNRLLIEGIKCEIEYIPEVLNLENYVDLLKNCDVVLSARMHSLILGQSAGCDVIPWKVSKKIESYENEYLNKNIHNMQIDIKNEISILLEM